ncbi:MAG: ADP-glyceromanno-heptose 6-epimerase [Cytophagia bacterium]|nr:ADP-glyceromanno-heptose 6-epimerase [Cytophagia bacterium]
MIIVTGAGGFIGSNLAARLAGLGYRDLVLVDDWNDGTKALRLESGLTGQTVHRDAFPEWLHQNQAYVQQVFHLGARTDTMLGDEEVFERLNLNYSKEVWKVCAAFGLPLVYASSAATYGGGEQGFKDGTEGLERYRPLNPYAWSKHRFDLWVSEQTRTPLRWAGLKFFNVYGPGEGPKGRMASVVWHAYRQIQETGKVKLFRSHRPDVQDGHQSRDFVFVDDVAAVCLWFMTHEHPSGIYNLGSGRARTFMDLVLALFKSLNLEPNLEFVDTPLEIRESYQYYTCADMQWMHPLGCEHAFTDLETGVASYVSREWGSQR